MSAATSSRMETPASQDVLAKGVTVTGEIHSSQPLTIEGEVEGTIDVTGQLLTIRAQRKRARKRQGQGDRRARLAAR
jgi:cytoskeletal protein CcmA (bactofilin family)